MNRVRKPITYCRLLVFTVSALMLPLTAWAGSQDRYEVKANGVVLEVSAVRDDIVRVRMGQDQLPEDASWAVLPEARTAKVSLNVTEDAGTAKIETAALTVTVDKESLRVTVTDHKGHVILDDAKGTPLRFENGGFRMRKRLPDDMHIFGLGDKTGPLDRREQAFTLWNTDSFGFSSSTDPIYKSIPFFLGVDEAGASYGFFLDNSWRTAFDFGKSERDAFAVTAEGGPVDYYVLAGPDAKSVIKAYAHLTGTAPLTPQWALGFQQSHWSYMDDAEVRSIADRLRAGKIPADVIYMDIDYQDQNRPFTVNGKAFPDLPKLVSDLKNQNMHLVLITDLHIAKVEGQDYAPYDSGKKADLFVKNPDGSDYVGAVWPGPSVFPDFSRPAAREWWGKLYADFAKMGVGGFWNDMNEPAIFNVRSKTMPLDVVHRIEEPGFAPRTTTQLEMHNVFGMLNSKATYEGVLKLAPDVRPFVLTRASYAGGHRYAATWTGDNSSSWDHLKLSTYQLVNLGISGFSYSGDDIGGFAGEAPTAELLTRWIEIGAFNPIFRDHYQKDKAPQEVWVHGPDHEAIRRRYIEERYRLMPYIYGLAEENSRTGLPIMRPVFLNYPSVLSKGLRFGDTADQFLLGDDLLIAPSSAMESHSPYVINLPTEGWYDYWTGKAITGTKLTETPTLERLPVFVRPGAIIPRQPLVQSTMETPKGALELHVYPGKDCKGQLYFDDGVSFGYQRGEYLRQGVTCQQTAKGLVIDFSAREGKFKPWWTGLKIVVHGADHEAKAAFGRKKLSTVYDAAAQTVTIDSADIATKASLVLERDDFK